MATPLRQFNTRLYLEHLEDASFLYDQWTAYRHDPEVNWTDLRDWENRLEAHIDALVLGGALAEDICRQRVAAGDAGEMYVAVRVLCRHRREAIVFGLLNSIEVENPANVRAASLALSQEAPADWRDNIVRAFTATPSLTQLLAVVIGYRRVMAEDALRVRLIEGALPGRMELLWALGRVGSSTSIPVLRRFLEDDVNQICEAAAIALMRLGDAAPLRFAADRSWSTPWARRVLGIAGGSHSVPDLLEMARDRADSEGVLALGLLGELSAVAPLLKLLDHEDIADAAATALNTITGARLYARVFVPDVFDPDELFPEERAAYLKDGTLPARHGKPHGARERRPERDKSVWRQWLDRNRDRFSRDHRWRMGKPHGPASLVECLAEPTTPNAVRVATYEELVIRYRLDVPFELELSVSRQLRCLRHMEAWAQRHAGVADGGWYFGGGIQS